MKMNFTKNKPILTMLLSFILIMSSLYQLPAPIAHAKRDKTPPSAPSNLTAVSVTDSSVSLRWNASTDNVGVKSYLIYQNSISIGSTSATTYQVNGLSYEKTYSFYVKAIDYTYNISKASNILSVTTARAPVTPTPTVTISPAPTAAPTATPTVTPTSTPTAVPTAAPTITPTPFPTSVPTQKVVGYYAAWSAYSGFTPDKIDAIKLTHINYAFANIGSDLKIAMGYPDIDQANFKKLNALKLTNPNLKTLIAVGGWSWSGKFSDAALTDVSRTAFADSCVNFIVTYGFDGIDIDWEYPVSGGMSTNVTRPEDKTNFTLLLQTLRKKLDTQEAIDGKEYLLSFAGAPDIGFVNHTELGLIQSYVDYANLMTYDIHGTWDSYTDFNAPLYRNSDTSPQYKWSVDEGVRTWINANFPKEKIVMGVPFYGYIYNSVPNVKYGLYQRYAGGSSISYSQIAANYLNAPGYVRHFHPESMVPWLFNGSTFITYEDPESMQKKAEYINTNGLGGAMIWELSQDPNRILLNALYNGLN
jgi:chitinase